MGKIAIVLGTKAEFLRLFPLMLYLQKEGEPYDIIHTCQHDLGDHLNEYGVKPCSFIDLPEYANIEPKLTFGNLNKIGGICRKLTRELNELSPKWTVYQGDTFTTGFAAYACTRAKVRGAHVEAGFRSGDWREPFPEELIRRRADRWSDLLFATSHREKQTLIDEDVSGEIVVSGSTIRDSVDYVLPLPNKKPRGDYAVVTMHRYENVFNEKRVKRIREILRLSSFRLIWPIHELTRKRLNLQAFPGIEFVPLMDYPRFMELVAGSSYTITDGGSLEEESILLGRRCLLLRKQTERMQSVEHGLTFLTGLDPERAKDKIESIETLPPADGSDPYYLGRSASEIIGERLLA